MPEMSGPVLVLVGIIVLAVLARLTAWLLDRRTNPHGAVADLLGALMARRDTRAADHITGDWDQTAQAYAQGMGRMLAAPRESAPFKLKSATIEGDHGTVLVEVPLLPAVELLVGEGSLNVPHVVVLQDERWVVDLHETERALRDDRIHRLVFASAEDSSEQWWSGDEAAGSSSAQADQPSRGRRE